jgi:hypothetical protein
MSITINDLSPKPFKVNVKGLELTSQPLRLSHALVLTKIGNIFQNIEGAKKAEITQAEKDLDEVIGELIPELKDIKLDMATTLSLIEQLMSTIEPDDNKELKEKGVSFNSDLKAQTTGL